MTYTIYSILPELLTHCIAIGMNQKYSKSTCSDCSDPFNMSDFLALEPHKGCDSVGESQKRITVLNQHV